VRSRPARNTNPTSKLRDTNNIEKANLSFQRKAVQEFHSRQAAVEVPSHADDIPPHAPALSSPATENGSRSNTMAAIENLETSNGDDMDDADEQPRQRTSVFIFSSLS
jgi:hypothetical protein